MNRNGSTRVTTPEFKSMCLLPVSKESDQLVLEYIRRRERSSPRPSAKATTPQPQHWTDLNAIFDFASDVAKLDTKRLYYLW